MKKMYIVCNWDRFIWWTIVRFKKLVYKTIWVASDLKSYFTKQVDVVNVLNCMSKKGTKIQNF